MNKIVALALVAFVATAVVGCGGTTTAGVSGGGVSVATKK